MSTNCILKMLCFTSSNSSRLNLNIENSCLINNILQQTFLDYYKKFIAFEISPNYTIPRIFT